MSVAVPPKSSGKMIVAGTLRCSELARQVLAAPVASGVRDTSNTLNMMRQAFTHADFDAVTTHYFRKDRRHLDG